MEWYLRIIQHHEQGGLFGLGERQALVEQPIGGFLAKELLEFRRQFPLSLGRGILLIGQLNLKPVPIVKTTISEK